MMGLETFQYCRNPCKAQKQREALKGTRTNKLILHQCCLSSLSIWASGPRFRPLYTGSFPGWAGKWAKFHMIRWYHPQTCESNLVYRFGSSRIWCLVPLRVGMNKKRGQKPDLPSWEPSLHSLKKGKGGLLFKPMFFLEHISCFI